jgi:hypothetical protein
LVHILTGSSSLSVVEALSSGTLRFPIIPARRSISRFLVYTSSYLLCVISLEKVHAGIRTGSVLKIDHISGCLYVIAVLLHHLSGTHLIIHLPLS